MNNQQKPQPEKKNPYPKWTPMWVNWNIIHNHGKMR